MLRVPFSVVQTGRSVGLRRSVAFVCLLLLVFPSCVQRRVVVPKQAARNPYKPAEPRNLSEYIRSVMKLSYGERKSATQSAAGNTTPTAGAQAQTPNAAESQGTVLERLQIAIAQHKSGAYLAAFEQLDALEKDAPEHALVQLQLGILWHDWANYPRARVHAERAVAIQPGLDEAWELLGRVNLRSGNFTAAIESYRKALACGPEIAERRANLGFALMQTKAWSDAEEQLRRALELDGQIIEARNNLGVTLAHLGKRDEALSQFLKVSEPAAAWNNLGVVLRERKLWSEARAAFRQALVLKPDYRKGQLNLAEMNAYLPPPSTVYLPVFPSQQDERLAGQSNLQAAASAASVSTATAAQSPATRETPAASAVVAARTEGPAALPAAVSIRWAQDGPVAASGTNRVASGRGAEPMLTARLDQPAAIPLALGYDLAPSPASISQPSFKPRALAGDLETIAQELSRNGPGRAVQKAIADSVQRRIENMTALDVPNEFALSSAHAPSNIQEPDFPSVLDDSPGGTWGPWPVISEFGPTSIQALNWQHALRPGALGLGISVSNQGAGQAGGSGYTAPPAWLGALTILLLFGLALVFFGLPVAALIVCLGLFAWLGMAIAAFF